MYNNKATLYCMKLLQYNWQLLSKYKRGFFSTLTLKNREGLPSDVWKLGQLNHIAIATPNLEKTTSFYRDVLGAEVSEEISLPEHGVITVFVNVNNTKIELLKPLGDKSPIQNFLNKNKDGGMHHICLEVDNIILAMKQLKEKGIRCLGEEPRIGAHGKPVIFLHPKDCAGVLIELEETKK